MLALILGTYGGAEGAGLGKVSDLQGQTAANGYKGNTIYYGVFMQDSDGNSDYKKGSDGRYQGVAYKVLDNTDTSKVVVMSDKAVDAGNFRTDSGQPDSNQWATSDIKKRLNSNNDSYLSKAFSAKESELLVDATVTTYPYQSTTGGTESTQKIYILSTEEITKYFGVQAADFSTAHPELKAQLTDYAVAQGGLQIDSCNWWLRSPSSTTYRVAIVDFFNKVYLNGYYTYDAYPGVRPVLR